jgi:hypothetical protein
MPLQKQVADKDTATGNQIGDQKQPTRPYDFHRINLDPVELNVCGRFMRHVDIDLTDSRVRMDASIG